MATADEMENRVDVDVRPNQLNRVRTEVTKRWADVTDARYNVLRFQERFPESILYFLLGSDSFSQIATWERWMDLADRAHLVVLHRAHIWGDELTERIPNELKNRIQLIRPFQNVPDPVAQTVYLLDHEPFPISATSIRERQQRGRPIRELVPHEEHTYIEKYDLYQDREDLESREHAHADR